MGGLSFDDALPIIVRKALEAMGIEQFGQLFVGLPPEKQAEMDALVEKELAKQGKGGPTTLPNMLRPWADPEVISAERMKTNPANQNNYESVKPPTYGETMNELAGSDRTILSSLDRVGQLTTRQA